MAPVANSRSRSSRATGRTTLAGVALSTDRPRSWLSIRRDRGVPTQHVEPTELADSSPSASQTLLNFANALWFAASNSSEPGSYLGQGVARRECLEVATEHDVDTSTGHVRRDGDGVHSTGLGDDLGLAEVLFRVQDLVGDPCCARVRATAIPTFRPRRCQAGSAVQGRCARERPRRSLQIWRLRS